MSIKEHPPQDESTNDSLHVPVLLDQTLAQLKPAEGEKYLDLTAGYGGHARRFLEQTKNYSDACLVDRDEFAIEHLKEFQAKGSRLLHEDFVSAAQRLIAEGRTFDIVLVDLGVSSPQLDMGERGFSFKHDGPLDMRMDRSQDFSAATLVNEASVGEIQDIIRRYGEEPLPFARRIAEAIVQGRPFQTTGQLADTIKSVSSGRWTKIHPATRTFQALRIAVNQELTQVEQLLPLLPKLLRQQGRVGVISFHSLEDRLVKRYFAEQAASGFEAELDIVTKKAIKGATYDVHNPRSRSAILRIAVKK